MPIRARASLHRQTSSVAFVCLSLVAVPRAANAIEVVAHARLSQPAVGCASAPDVAFWQGDFDVVFSAAPAVCSMATGRSLASVRVIPSTPMSVGPGRGPTVTAGLQLFGAVATIDASVPKLVHAAVARSPGPSTMLHWSVVDSDGASSSGSGTLGTAGEAMVDLAMDCFAGRCTVSTIERSASSYVAARVLLSIEPLTGWSMPLPTMIPAAQRGNVVQLGAGPWTLLSTDAPTVVAVDPIGVARVVPLTAVSHGVVGVRRDPANIRAFLSLVASGVALVQVHDSAFTASVDTFNLSEALELSDADRFVADNARILAGWSASSSTIRAVIYSESPRRALTTNALGVRAMGGVVRSVRVAAGRGAQEGRALIVYESRGGSTDSSVYGVLVQCSANAECEDGNPMTDDVCASQGGGVKRCVHNTLSGADGGVGFPDASPSSDASADASGGAADASPDALAPRDDVVIEPGMDATIADADSVGDAAATDARSAALPRITGGACDCRAGAVGPGGRGAVAWAAGAALAATVGARRRRRRQL
jgi:hypothetical protein